MNVQVTYASGKCEQYNKARLKLHPSGVFVLEIEGDGMLLIPFSGTQAVLVRGEEGAVEDDSEVIEGDFTPKGAEE